MVKLSRDRNTNTLLSTIQRMQGAKKIEELSEFAQNMNYHMVASKKLPKEYINGVSESLTLNDAELLRRFSGIDYKKINNVFRGFWDYEQLGAQRPNDIQYIKEYGERLSDVFKRKAQATPNQTIVYRGTNLASFRSFGAQSLEDLKFLVGEFVYEQGFLSTSLSRNHSFFNRPLEYHHLCNIEVVYILPKGTREIIPLATSDTSYSPSQQEVLINKGSLSKITDVIVRGNSAQITAVLIPTQIWEPEPPTAEKTNQ